jgi:dolichyl-diphosphooligosaccharide--protein glycosyltransferase
MDREKRYESIEVLAVAILGLALRLFAGWNTLQGGAVLFDGYDEFYHMRRILYTVNHFPNTLWSDSYLNYPHGLQLTWPPLFDQVVATAAVVLGARSQPAVEMVGAVIPAIIGSVAVVAVYYLVREIFDRRTALLSAFMTALAPYFLQKSILGDPDHHCLEAFLFVCAVLFLAMALSRRKRRLAFAAGVAMAGLAYTWLGSAAYFGILLLYAAAQMTIDLKSGRSSKDTVLTLLWAFGVALALILPFWNMPWLSPTFFGLAAIVAALALLFAITLLLSSRKVHWAAFPVIILLLAYGFLLLSQLLSHFWIFSNVDALIRSGGDYLFSGGMTGKISEAEPLFVHPEILFSNLGLNLLFSLFGLAALANSLRSQGERRARLLFLVWALSTLILTIGQIRFLYLSSITMGILIALLFFQCLDLAEKRWPGKGLPKALAAILLLVLVLPSAAEVASISSSIPPIAGDWYESLVWLEGNSNQTSWYDQPDKVAEYSVLSWWDYGNWILYKARRPVVANNFQAGVGDSARFYLSEREEDAAAIIDSRGSRYVFTDYDMLYGKLPALAVWVEEDPSTYLRFVDYGRYVTAVPLKRLMSTTMAKLHFYDASGLGHFRLIHESPTVVGANPPTSKVKIFEYVPGAVIRGTTALDQPVGILLNLTSNRGRPFQYFAMAVPRDGGYELRVPYSTERGREVHALDPYLVFAGGRTRQLEVSDEDVLKGRALVVNF